MDYFISLLFFNKDGFHIITNFDEPLNKEIKKTNNNNDQCPCHWIAFDFYYRLFRFQNIFGISDIQFPSLLHFIDLEKSQLKKQNSLK